MQLLWCQPLTPELRPDLEALVLFIVSFVTLLTALTSGPSGLSILTCFRTLRKEGRNSQDAEGSMRVRIPQKDHKAFSYCLTAVLQMTQT